MSVWTIDGTVEAAEVMHRKGGFVVLRTLKIRDAAGAEQSFAKVCAAGEVAKALTPGASGRFYLTKAFDQTGVHGLRLADGRAAYAHFNNLEVIALIAVGAGLAMLAIILAGASGAMVTPVVILPLAAILWFFLRKSRLESRAQYEADAKPA